MPSFFFKATSTTEIYTLYLHDALPISSRPCTGTAMSLMAWTTACCAFWRPRLMRSEEHTSELQSRENLVCRLFFLKLRQQPKSTLFTYTTLFRSPHGLARGRPCP